MSDTPETFRSLVREWLEEYHQISSAHFGDREAERIANTKRICAERLSALIDAWERRMVELQRESGTVTINSILWRMLGPKEQAADGDSEAPARARSGLQPKGKY